jgi:hypothetical protein
MAEQPIVMAKVNVLMALTHEVSLLVEKNVPPASFIGKLTQLLVETSYWSVFLSGWIGMFVIEVSEESVHAILVN